MKKIFFTVSFMFIYCSLFAGLSVEPAISNIKVKPSKQYNGEYTVTNTYDKPIDITIQVEDWNSFPGNTDLNVNDWFKIENNSYALAAGQTVTIPYTVSINENLKGSVSVRLEFFVDKNKNTNKVSVSIPLYVTVLGTEQLDFDIENITLFTENTDISFKADVINKGNIHIRPNFYIEIYDSKKEKIIEKINIPETVPVYAQKSRQLQNKLIESKKLEKGKYHAVFKTRALDKEVVKEVIFKISDDKNITSQELLKNN